MPTWSGSSDPLPAGRSRGRFGRTALATLVLAALLSWLFVQADALSSRNHDDYTRELRLLRQADAELNAAVLASRLGLQHDYDLIVAGVANIEHLLRRLHGVPDFLTHQDNDAIMVALHALEDAQAQKNLHIDLFKREHAVLRNSQTFLPVATDTFVNDVSNPVEHARPVATLVRGVMTALQSDDTEALERLLGQLERLEATVDQAPTEVDRERLRNVLLHTRVVLERTRLVNKLTREIMATPIATLVERLEDAYSHGHSRAARAANGYRALLYVAALGLAAYLMLIMVRLNSTGRALTRANDELTRQLETLRRTQHQLDLYANVFNHATEGMTITDSQSRILAVNPAFTRITGYELRDVAGKTPAVLSSGRQNTQFYRDMWATLDAEGQWSGEIWNRRRDGEVYPEWLSITAVRDQSKASSYYIGIFSDITVRKETEARIHHLAYHDALTNLPNRSLLVDRLEQAILKARRSQRCTAVILVNLDRFKLINDTLGHEVGDALLMQVAQRCQQLVRETDTVARQAADEFVIVLPELDHAQEATLVARKLLDALGRAYRLGEHELTVTASVGIALFPQDGADVATLLRNADAAMSVAKGDGRNRLQFYSTDLHTTSLSELLLENQLRNALERDELRLYYQPKIDAISGRLHSAEALLRWQHPELGLLSPTRFVPVAEDCGLIIPIGEWVLRSACRQLRAWIDQGHRVAPVAVNLSAKQFAQKDIVDMVRSALDESRLDPAMLELELTETALMRDANRAVIILDQLRAMGVGLAIDDFGTGYASLAYLRRFQVDTLKIDRSFVNDIRLNGADDKIAAAVISLAHSLGLQVVAEGVETDYQRTFLQHHRCDVLQGYLFGHPEPASAFVGRLGAST